MSSEGSGEKTEEPTAKKLRDARERGNVPKSKDLTGALGLIGGILALKYGGFFMAEYLMTFTVKILTIDLPTLDVPFRKEIIPYAVDWFLWLLIVLIPFLALVFVAAIIANVIQTGLLFTTHPLKLDLNKLNPVSGFKRLFSVKNIVMLLMNIAKLAIIMPIAWHTIFTELQSVIVIVEMEAPGTFIMMCRVVLDLALKLAVLLFILGVIDYWYQKQKYIKDLKMTKQEIKEEYKQMEGDPKVKQKRRQIQMQMAQQRMMNEVPQAEVVVRNPTHFAVALSYKPETMAAPVVVAKGKDRIALKIIEAARDARVPTISNPPLARQLFKMAEVGEEIPAELFPAVAEILAFVMKDKYAPGAAGAGNERFAG